MRVEIKTGFDAIGTRPECFWGVLVIMGVFDDFGIPMVCVSGNDGVHGVKSEHYSGAAQDFRARDPGGSWEVDDDQGVLIETAVRERWGQHKDYEFYYESDLFDESGKQTRWKHFHFEYQRKRRD